MTGKLRYTLTINGAAYPVEAEARRTLADVLREECRLPGTRIGCEHGVCGACTILLDDQPVRSCLVFGIQAQDAEIRTVEGLGGETSLNALQQAFIDHHALQCGYCTAGFLMLATAILERPDKPDRAELTHLLSSNLCRCTGYQNIIDAVESQLESRRGSGTAPA